MCTRWLRGRRFGTGCILGLWLVGAWAVSSCQGAEVPGEPRATPKPGFDHFDSASRSAVLAYVADSLHFDSTPGASDEQRLLTDTLCDSSRALSASHAREQAPSSAAATRRLSDSTLLFLSGCTVGPRVRIDPEIGAYRIGKAGIREGRIIARMVNLDPIAYPKLNLQARGTTYWWVDSAGPGGYRSVYVPADTTVATMGAALNVHDEGPNVRWRQALARFLVVDKDDEVWTACDPNYCCNTTALR